MFPTMGKSTIWTLLCLVSNEKVFFFFFSPQILQAEKEKQELQHQFQLSELMDKQAREVQQLG